MDSKLKDLNDLVDIRYQKKQKNKVDFLLEVKNMHHQMKLYAERFNETKEINEIVVEMFQYIKVLECEVNKAN